MFGGGDLLFWYNSPMTARTINTWALGIMLLTFTAIVYATYFLRRWESVGYLALMLVVYAGLCSYLYSQPYLRAHRSASLSVFGITSGLAIVLHE